MPPFVDLIEGENVEGAHRYFVCRGRDRYAFTPRENLTIVSSFSEIQSMLASMLSADKIILHGLYFDVANKLLLEHPNLFSKCYWAMWGNDFYFPEIQPQWKMEFIKQIRYCLTSNIGDYYLARDWYEMNADILECVGYTSNVFAFDTPVLGAGDLVRIQLGNSADPENNHLEILESLAGITEVSFHVYAPLSYGGEEHARAIAGAGKEILGERFTAMLDYLSLQDYQQFWTQVDIAIFNHRKQQAMGNLVNLLGLGKKVYMQKDLSSWRSFTELGLNVYDIADGIDLTRLNTELAVQNHLRIASHYTLKRVVTDWNCVFKHAPTDVTGSGHQKH